jgi:predicted NodU family carbamoyl transferase
MNTTSSSSFTTLQRAARTAATEGHAVEAEAILRRVATLVEREFGRASGEYANCMHELADVCAERQDWKQAEHDYCAAIDAYRYCPSDTAVVLALRSLGEILRHQGKTLEARQVERQAGSILARRFAPGQCDGQQLM